MLAAMGILVALVLQGIVPLAAAGGAPIAPRGSPVPAGGSRAAATFPTPIRHVVTVMLENEPRSAVLAQGPFERYLAATYASASSYYGVCHPSAPNYLAATSGSTWQCGSDNYNVYNSSNIGDLMENASLPAWYGFMENMTHPCQTSSSGNYAIKHNPFPYYYDIVKGANSRCDRHDLPLTSWNGNVTNGTVPTYAWITPDQNHDGHNTNVSVADSWLKQWMSPLINDSWFNSTVFFVVWDEATGSNSNAGYNGTSGGLVYLTAVSPYAKKNYTLTTNASHYNLLSTTEWLLGLGATGNNDSTSTFPAMKALFNFSLGSAPAAPTGLSATTKSASSIALSWTNPSGGGLTNNTVYRGSSCGSWTRADSLGVATSVTVTGLAPHTFYCFAVSAWNSSGESPRSASATAATWGVPSAPTGLTISNLTSSTLSLAWTNPSGGGLLNATVYRGSTCGQLRNVTSVGAVSATNVTGLTAHSYYCFAVGAWNSSGESALSASASTATIGTPAAPSGLTATNVTATGLDLTWTNPAGGGLLNDTIYRGTSCSMLTNVTSLGVATSARVTGLTPHTFYCFGVAAWNGSGAGPISSTASTTTTGVPAAPTGLTAGTVTSTTVALSWHNPSGGGLRNDTVYRGASCGSWNNVSSLGVTSSTNITGLSVHRTYCFAVSAWNGSGESALSGTVRIATGGVPAAPTGLTASNITSASVRLNWTNPSGGGLLNDTLYRGTTCTVLTNVSSLGATSSSRVTGLSNHVSYCFAVSAWNVSGESALSGTVTVTTSGAPAAPTGLTASNITNRSVELNWTNPSGGGLLNDTLYRGTSCANLTNVTSLGRTTSTNVTGLSDHVRYCFAVSAWNASGESLRSGNVTVTTSGVPAAPTGLTVSNVTSTGLDLAWSNPAGGGLVNDTLDRGTACGTWTNITSLGVATSANVTGLASHTFYCFAVRAWNDTGASPNSSSASAATSGPPGAPGGLHVVNLSSTSALLAWSNPSGGGLTNVTLYVGAACGSWDRAVSVGVVGASIVGGLTAHTYYCFAATAWNDSGPSPLSGYAEGATVGVPAAPTGLAVAAVTASSVDLRWTLPPGGGVTNLSIEVGTVCGVWTRTVSVGAVTSGSVGGLAASTLYCFAVRAWNSSGGSGLSSTVRASTFGPPAPPTSVTAVALDDASISVGWTNPPGALLADTVSWGVDCTALTNNATTLGAATSLTVGGLRPATSYCVVVTARNLYGDSVASATASATTRPGAATALAVIGQNTTNLSLAWTNPVPSPSNVTLLAGASCGSWTWTLSVGVASRYVASGLAPNSIYCFAVETWSAGGPTLSGSVEGATLPGSPTLLRAASTNWSTVELSWTQPAGPVTFDVVLWGPSCGTWLASVTLPAESSYNVTGLDPNASYCFAVVALDGSLRSPPSAPVQASTPAAPGRTTPPGGGGGAWGTALPWYGWVGILGLVALGALVAARRATRRPPRPARAGATFPR
jgi:Phosphoesterase family/Fibronectin type III domain